MNAGYPLIRLACLALLTSMAVVEVVRSAVSSQAVPVPLESRWVALAGGGWVSIDGGRVRFHSADGDEENSVAQAGREVLVSPPGGHAAAILVYADHEPISLELIRFELYGQSGVKKLTLASPGFSSAVVSPTGDAFVGIAGAEGLKESLLKFYQGDGSLSDTMRVRFYEGGEYTRDGSHFIFKTAAEGLQIASRMGKLLHTLGPADSWGASADGLVIGVSRASSLAFFRKGEPIGSVARPESEGTIRAIAISPDHRFAAAISAARASLIRLDGLLVLWSSAPESPFWNYRSLDLSAGASDIVLGLDYDPGSQSMDRHRQSRCVILGQDGTPLHQESATPSEWGASFPQVRLDETGRKVLFLNRDSARWLTLE